MAVHSCSHLLAHLRRASYISAVVSTYSDLTGHSSRDVLAGLMASLHCCTQHCLPTAGCMHEKQIFSLISGPSWKTLDTTA